MSNKNIFTQNCIKYSLECNAKILLDTSACDDWLGSF